MNKVLSWIIAICFLLLILGLFPFSFMAVEYLSVFILIIFIIIGISAIILIILLILERIKDRKEEKDDINKY